MLTINNTGTVSPSDSLRRFYLHDPLIRFIASRSVLAAIIAQLVGFWLLVAVNWWTGSVWWSKPPTPMNTFLSQPVDWIYVFTLIPVGFWLLGRYYDSLLQSMNQLVDEKIIDPQNMSSKLDSWNSKRYATACFSAARWLVVALLAYLMWATFKDWTPPKTTAWFSNTNGTPTMPGCVMIVLAMVESYVLFTYAFDTIRFAVFHMYLLQEERCSHPAESAARMVPNHPDGAFGYAPLAIPMNHAAILAMVTLASVVTFVSGPLALFLKSGAFPINSMFVIGIVLPVVLLPWIIFGPVWPFISVLRRQRNERLLALRGMLANDLERRGPVVREWNSLRSGWPYLIDKRSVGALIATLIFSNAGQLGSALVALARLTTPSP